MTESGPSTGDKRKHGGDKSAQKHKFYKYQGRGGGGHQRGGRGGGNRGGRGGRGGGRGGHAAASGDRGGEGRDRDVGLNREELNRKKSAMGRYRIVPLPEMLTKPGICVTTWKDKERAAEAELIDFLERIADELYPETIEESVKDEPGADELDLEDMLKKDLAAMSNDNKSKRFQLCVHNIMCVIYINVLPPLSSHKLVRHILEQAESAARTPLKYCKRLIPMSATCGATVKQLAQCASEVVKKEFETDDGRPLKFAIDTNTRSSDKMERMQMITTIAEEITKLEKGHSVDLKNPDKTVLAELYKNTVGLTVLDDYERFKKYNPGSVAAAAAASRGAALKLKDGDAEASTGTGESSGEHDQGSESSNKESKGTPQHVYRQRRAEAIANQSSNSTFNSNLNPAGAAVTEADAEDVEVGEVLSHNDDDEAAESGQILEEPLQRELKDGWVETIENGKVSRTKESEGDDA
ncbi:hypothetical protein I317_02139 [Kwoniella heveanensis CBS 569]|nr:hypothetical protein I317_02139 [Kwoniella heveanensis CBS 569]